MKRTCTHARFTFCCSTGMHSVDVNRDQPSVTVVQRRLTSFFPRDDLAQLITAAFPSPEPVWVLHTPFGFAGLLFLEKVIRPQTGWVSKISITRLKRFHPGSTFRSQTKLDQTSWLCKLHVGQCCSKAPLQMGVFTKYFPRIKLETQFANSDNLEERSVSPPGGDNPPSVPR